MPNIHNNQSLDERRKELRHNQTPEENKIWQLVRNKGLGFKFYRQHSIGIYIVDFYCPQKKLIIEVDGNHHKDNIEYDRERTSYLERLGFKVIRFWNQEINQDFPNVFERIKAILN